MPYLKEWLLKLLLVSVCASILACSVPSTVSPSLADQQLVADLIDQGTANLRANRIEQAEASFRVAHELEPQARTLDGLACVAWASGQNDRAVDLLQQAIAADPRYVQALANLAFMLEQQGRFSESQALFAKSIELAPESVMARNNYAAQLFEAHQMEEARSQLLAGAAISENPVIQRNLVSIKLYKGQQNER